MKYVYYHKLECRVTVSAAGPCEKNDLGPLTFPSVNTTSGCVGGKAWELFYITQEYALLKLRNMGNY